MGWERKMKIFRLTTIPTEAVGDGIAARRNLGDLFQWAAGDLEPFVGDDIVVAEHTARVVAAVGAVADGL